MPLTPYQKHELRTQRQEIAQTSRKRRVRPLNRPLVNLVVPTSPFMDMTRFANSVDAKRTTGPDTTGLTLAHLAWSLLAWKRTPTPTKAQ
jgi:hypothetical protein